VAVATSFLLGLAIFMRWRAAWLLLVLWVPLMAISRMYLGRHFPADVVGGVAVGVVAAAAAVWLGLDQLEHRPRAGRIVVRFVALAVAASVFALAVKLPAPYDAGRLLGVASGVLLVLRMTRDDRNLGPSGGNSGRIVLAGAIFGAAWWGVPHLVVAIGLSTLRGTGALLAGTIPMLLLLAGPVLLTRLAGRLVAKGA
jgi:membrane-associated phospholipid phosphatase